MKNLARSASTDYGSKKISEFAPICLAVLEVDEFVLQLQMSVYELLTYNVNIYTFMHYPSELLTVFSMVMKLR